MDHDHTTGLFRNFLCNRCNTQRLDDNTLNKNNTSGHKNISFSKTENKWRYATQLYIPELKTTKYISRYFNTLEEAIKFKSKSV